MVGRWPSFTSSARANSALISLSSATRIESPALGHPAAVGASTKSAVGADLKLSSSAKRAANETARTGLIKYPVNPAALSVEARRALPAPTARYAVEYPRRAAPALGS